MDGNAVSLTPVVIAFIVGLIGAVGLFAALRAAYEVGHERDALQQGRSALADLPMPQDRSFDYRGWLKDRDPRLADSHFGDHLRAAADATRSGRAVSLHELHEVSARREARRVWARLSGGITALLLVCGIAGTLWAIKPVLEGFNLGADAAGVTEAANNAEQATQMIQALSRAFLPSLVALVGTVLVAFTRGLYAHRRGLLAGELDRLDLEDLFQRFPPRSLSQELDGVRAQLADLTAQMLASQRNLDGFVQRLTDAASGFHHDAPPLQEASTRFVGGVLQLAPKLDALSDTIASHLGATAPVVSRFDGLLAVAGDVNKAAAQMQLAGSILSKHLAESHQLLRATTEALPAQLQAACTSASTVIADATSKALTEACTAAVQRLDAAAAPLREAAQSVAVENRALKAETSAAIARLTQRVEALCAASTAAMAQDLERGLAGITGQMELRLAENSRQVATQLEVAQAAFRQSLDAALAEITGLHDGTMAAIAHAADTVGRLEEVQTRIDNAQRESSQTRAAITTAQGQITIAADRLTGMTAELDRAQRTLAEVQESATTTAERLAGLVANVGQVTDDANTLRPALESLMLAQQETVTRTEALLNRAERVGADGQRWLPEAARLHDMGLKLPGELERLLEQGRTVAGELATAATAVGDQQQRLAQDLATLTAALEPLRPADSSDVVGRFFGTRE